VPTLCVLPDDSEKYACQHFIWQRARSGDNPNAFPPVKYWAASSSINAWSMISATRANFDQWKKTVAADGNFSKPALPYLRSRILDISAQGHLSRRRRPCRPTTGKDMTYNPLYPSIYWAGKPSRLTANNDYQMAIAKRFWPMHIDMKMV